MPASVGGGCSCVRAVSALLCSLTCPLSFCAWLYGCGGDRGSSGDCDRVRMGRGRGTTGQQSKGIGDWRGRALLGRVDRSRPWLGGRESELPGLFLRGKHCPQEIMSISCRIAEIESRMSGGAVVQRWVRQSCLLRPCRPPVPHVFPVLPEELARGSHPEAAHGAAMAAAALLRVRRQPAAHEAEHRAKRWSSKAVRSPLPHASDWIRRGCCAGLSCGCCTSPPPLRSSARRSHRAIGGASCKAAIGQENRRSALLRDCCSHSLRLSLPPLLLVCVVVQRLCDALRSFGGSVGRGWSDRCGVAHLPRLEGGGTNAATDASDTSEECRGTHGARQRCRPLDDDRHPPLPRDRTIPAPALHCVVRGSRTSPPLLRRIHCCAHCAFVSSVALLSAALLRSRL